MNHLTLRQLRYFDALARHSHFGRAAAACAISQPALSMQIKELEETLGAVLMERGVRQVRLTKFGEEAALRVRDILLLVDELGEFARASQGSAFRPAAHRHDPDDRTLSLAYSYGEPHSNASRS